jgi:hypothetical protein
VGNVTTPLSNGNYVVCSPVWNGNRGAVTWGSGSAGVKGAISAANSLVGANPGDYVGSRITALSNGNYVVGSPSWNGKRGAATWGSGTTGISGTVSAANSLVGANPSDQVGDFPGGITPLSNGNYVVRSPIWSNYIGAATWGSGTTGVSGMVSAANSLVGANPNDQVGISVTPLSNGNYVVSSPGWNSGRGAMTWGSGSAGVSGTVSAANSLVGSAVGESAGNSVVALSNGNYVVANPSWFGQRGAATWVSGTTGRTLDGNGTINPQNSLVGTVARAGLGSVSANPTTQTFLVSFTMEGSGRVAVGLEDPNGLSYGLGQDQTLTVAPNVLTATLNTGTAVVLQASNDITINSPITVRAGGQGGALTLQAGRSILLNAGITTDNGDLTLIANDSSANGVVDADRDPGAAVIRMADGATLDAGTGAVTITLGDGTGLTNSDSGAITLQTVTAGSLAVANDGPSPGSDVIVGPVTTTGAQDYSNPNGTTQVTGNLTTTDSPVTFHYSVALDAGLTLNVGAGAIMFASGTAPSPGVVHVRGGVALTDSATYSAALNDIDRSNCTRLLASGPIDLGGATLTVVLGFEPPVGRAFKILTTRVAGGIQGTFAGLPEGAVFDQGGFQFQISYQGGANGRSVVLTRIA